MADQRELLAVMARARAVSLRKSADGMSYPVDSVLYAMAHAEHAAIEALMELPIGDD